MINKKIIISILIFACLVIFSCTATEWKEWNENKDYYRASRFETEPFIGYYLIGFHNFENEEFQVLSKKTNPDNKLPPFKNYEIIKPGHYYKINLNKIDTVVVLYSRWRMDVFIP